MHDSYIHGVKVPLQFVALNDKCQKVKNNYMLIIMHKHFSKHYFTIIIISN